jgi:hypothetical protein
VQRIREFAPDEDFLGAGLIGIATATDAVGIKRESRNQAELISKEVF